MKALQTAERQSWTLEVSSRESWNRAAEPVRAGVTIFDYDGNLVCETETIARFLDCERDLSLGEIFAAR
ncbi:MAG: hypothetical protein AB7H70_12770 [Rhodospirillaceae bacterium]